MLPHLSGSSGPLHPRIPRLRHTQPPHPPHHPLGKEALLLPPCYSLPPAGQGGGQAQVGQPANHLQYIIV